MQTDKELGFRVHEHLKSLGLETPMLDNQLPANEKIEKVIPHFQEILTIFGLDLTDDSLEDTPRRMSKMWVNDFLSGMDYNNFPKMTCVENKMAAEDEFVCVSNIRVVSNCEHHGLIIFSDETTSGATIAYIPKDKVLGLSKLSRLWEFFQKRMTVHERLVNQVAEALKFIVGTDDVIVYADAKHSCMTYRGAKEPNSSTVALSAHGKFKTDATIRSEFMRIASQK